MDDTVASLAARLEQTGYLADDDLATVLFLALRMGRPLLLEGEPGTGKTALAEAIAEALDLPLIRLQCYEGIDATQALYDWDFPRQILHLRALEATGGATPTSSRRPRRACTTSASCSRDRCWLRCSRARRCCWSTRSTGPTTSSRRSCWRCSRRTRSPSPSSARSRPRPRRSSYSPPTAPANCTTRSSGAASTTGSTTRGWTARSPSSGHPGARGQRPLAAQVVRWCSSCATATTCRSRRASPRPWTGPGRSSTSARPTSTWRPPPATLGALVKYREDADRVRDALDRMLA